MEKNTNFKVVILCQEEHKIEILKSLLSNYYSINIAMVCHHEAEAIEFLNNHRISLFFLDMDLSHVLYDIQKPPFIVGLCDTINTKKVKQFLKMGFFELFYAPYTERELNSIMGKIMNIYGSYNKLEPQLIQHVEEESLKYSSEDNSAKSVFIQGTRNEESMRIVFDNVLFLKKIGNQVCVYFDDGFRKYFRSNLKMFQSKFPKTQFLKINRSVVVNVDKVTGHFKNKVLIADNDNFIITRSFKKPFLNALPK